MFGLAIKKVMTAVAVSGALTAASLGFARAEYPEKPVTLVIPFGAGGGHDLISRIITAVIPAYLGQPMIVQLTPGAGGQKGSQEVARAAADGYKLLFSHNYLDTLQQFVETMPYDPMTDFVPVARINYSAIAVIVRDDSPYQTFEDLVADATARPNAVRLAHSGNWGAVFVPGAQMMQARGFTFNMIPYQGGGPALQALISGDADVTLAFRSAYGELLTGGKVRVLATAGDKREFEDVPTFAEVGVEGDIGFIHRVIMAPAATPPEVLAKLRTAIEAMAADPTFVSLMGRLGESIDLLPSGEYQKMREDQAVAYKKLVDSLTSQ